MTLPEAIKALAFLSREGTQDMEFEDYEAVKLGIEALECIEYWRRVESNMQIPPLPSETN